MMAMKYPKKKTVMAGEVQIFASQDAKIEVQPNAVRDLARTKIPPANGRRERGR